MASADPRSWFDKAIGICLGALIAATAIYVAVRLIEAVWALLLVILGVGAFLAVAVFLLRGRNRGW